MLLCRCDSDHAEFITSVSDPRDHPYVLGATKRVQPFVDALAKGKQLRKSYLDTKAEWKESAALMTFDEAVQASSTERQYAAYAAQVSGKVFSLQERRGLALETTGQSVQFDWELPRTQYGQYMWKWCTKAVIERSILAAPLGDVTWSRQGRIFRTIYFSHNSSHADIE